jgi:type VI secretion system protein ImpH
MNAPDTIAGLTPLVLARASRMNFFQLCQLLERLASPRDGLGTRDSPAGEPVRFRPFPKVGFPGAEVAAVEVDDERPDRPPSVRTTFLGLYGVNAAMPPHLIDDIVLRREGHEEVMAFLDVFNHRIATLFYRAWRKYRYAAGFERGGSDPMSRNLLCLAGFGLGGKAASAGLLPVRVLGLLGLLTQRTRTAEGLAGIVALAAPGVGVTVDERFPVWVRLDDPPRLGSGGGHVIDKARLGLGHVRGRRVIDRGGAVRVTLTPASAAQAHGLLPDAPLHRDLVSLLRIYLGAKADVVLRMEVSAAIAPVLRLGRTREESASGGRLAWTMLLKPAGEIVITIRLGRYEAIPTAAATRRGMSGHFA